jgi:hypothetical protein
MMLQILKEGEKVYLRRNEFEVCAASEIVQRETFL